MRGQPRESATELHEGVPRRHCVLACLFVRSSRRLIIRAKLQRQLCTHMLATANEPYFYPNYATQPLEVHRSKISLTCARAGYDYPTIRLPFAFSRLIGLSTRIYQTVYDGALAFLVVVPPSRSSPDMRVANVSSPQAPRLDMAEVAGSNSAAMGFCFCEGWHLHLREEVT
jgi:hypothetical protein